MTINRRLLSLTIALIAAAIFIAVYRSAPVLPLTPAPSEDLSTAAVSGTRLKMSPRLVSVPATSSATDDSTSAHRSASPTRPLLLFLLAFASGWWLRQWIRSPQQPVAAAQQPQPVEQRDNIELDADEGSASFPTVIIPAADTLPDDLDDDLSNTAQIEVLQEKNVTKAKIIKALEKVVMENREKWINWDETEARMSTRIDELSRELSNAMRQAFQSPRKSDRSDQSESG